MYYKGTAPYGIDEIKNKLKKIDSLEKTIEENAKEIQMIQDELLKISKILSGQKISA